MQATQHPRVPLTPMRSAAWGPTPQPRSPDHATAPTQVKGVINATCQVSATHMTGHQHLQVVVIRPRVHGRLQMPSARQAAGGHRPRAGHAASSGRSEPNRPGQPASQPASQPGCSNEPNKGAESVSMRGRGFPPWRCVNTCPPPYSIDLFALVPPTCPIIALVGLQAAASGSRLGGSESPSGRAYVPLWRAASSVTGRRSADDAGHSTRRSASGVRSWRVG